MNTLYESKLRSITPYLFMIAGVILLVSISDMYLTTQLAGKISWTGVNASAITSILNVIMNGGSVASAVAAVVGIAAGGPVTALLTAYGRGMLIKWVKRRGIKSVATF